MFIMSKNQFDLITFGEIMLRLSPPRHERITDGDIFEKRAGGAELNVASGVALLGLRTGIISKTAGQQAGYIFEKPHSFRRRFGRLFNLRTKAPRRVWACIIMRWAPRPASRLLFMTAKSPAQRAFAWRKFLPKFTRARACSTPPASALLFVRRCATLSIELMKRFKEGGALISFDVNYRANLWSEESPVKPLKRFCRWLTFCLFPRKAAAACSRKQVRCMR